MNGDGLPMDFLVDVNAERQVVLLISKHPFDIAEGKVGFRLTASFMESTIGDALFDCINDCSSYTIDKYNDKLLALSTGTINLKKFIDMFN